MINQEALLMMGVTQGLVTLVTLYFFYRVLTAKPRPEPDSYLNNDDQPEP